MPTNHKLTFKDPSSGSDAQPPILERILEQYSSLYGVAGKKEVKLIQHQNPHRAFQFYSSKCPIRRLDGGELVEYRSAVGKPVGIIDPVIGEIKLDAYFSSQRELSCLNGVIRYFRLCEEAGYLDTYEKGMELQPVRNASGLIYLIMGTDIELVPSYCKETGRIMKLKVQWMSDIPNLIDENGREVNKLLFEEAQIIYRTTSEILSDLVK